MTQLQTLLLNDPNVRQFALSALKECPDMISFAATCLETVLNACMSAEADELCGAPYGQQSDERVNWRNGYRERGLETTVGDITLEIPKLRQGTYYPENIIEHWQRADGALVACIMEMYVNGVSTRKVERVAEELGVKSMSKSQVSRMAEELDAEVEQLRTSSLADRKVPYVWLDATYVHCRVDGKFVSVAVVTAIGCDDDGRKRFLGLDVVDVESYEDWRRFLLSLRDRGLSGVKNVTSDAHGGLRRAISEVFLGASWQRCVTHFIKNCADTCGGNASKQKLVREPLKATFAQTDPTLVKSCYHATIDALEREGCPKAAELMLEAEESVLNYLQYPVPHAKKIRTDNVQERANREIKRRTDTVQCFPSKESLLRLVGAVLVEENINWQAGTRMFYPESIATAYTFEAPVPTEWELLQAQEKAKEIVGKAVAKAKEDGV